MSFATLFAFGAWAVPDKCAHDKTHKHHNKGIQLAAFLDFIAANAPAFNLVSFLAGLLFGHRFALGRDKRQEFNIAVVPIRKWARNSLDGPIFSGPDMHQLDRFVYCMRWWKRGRFLRAHARYFECYQQGQKQDQETGTMLIEQTGEMKDLLNRIIRLTAYR